MSASNVHNQVVVGIGIEPPTPALPCLHCKAVLHYNTTLVKENTVRLFFYRRIYRDDIGDIGEDADSDVEISEPKLASMYVYLVLEVS